MTLTSYLIRKGPGISHVGRGSAGIFRYTRDESSMLATKSVHGRHAFLLLWIQVNESWIQLSKWEEDSEKKEGDVSTVLRNQARPASQVAAEAEEFRPWSQSACVQILVPSLPNCMTLGKLYWHFLFPYLQTRSAANIYIIESLQGLNGIIHVKFIA